MRTKIKEPSFEGSKMSPKPCSVFFLKQQGQSKYVILNKELQLITKHFAKSNCLYSLVNALKQKPTSGTKIIKIHYDNARPHINFSVKKYIKSKQLIIMDHPPYSPDLAPSDFWLFDYIK